VPGGAVRIAIGAVLALSPVLTALGLLGLAEWRDRRRATAIAWQVRLTDAISAELGGVVAPVVSKPLGARWRVAMRVPVARPALVSRVLASPTRHCESFGSRGTNSSSRRRPLQRDGAYRPPRTRFACARLGSRRLDRRRPGPMEAR